MTRRDRAAFALALECVRIWPAMAKVCDLDNYARGGVDAAVFALTAPAVTMGPFMLGQWAHTSAAPPRLLRARLALYLRAVLRADRGDYGACGDDCWGCRWAHVSDGFDHDAPRKCHPLWEMAPRSKG